MEHSPRVAVVPASFRWSDVGSWDEVCRLFGGTRENVLAVEAQDNFVFSEIPVALAGVRDLIVVVQGGVLMICRRGSSQLVRGLVRQAQEEGRSDLL
jgi:mannose-1-phosphate guanylyltransferase